jgi:AraC-like DNA-binding protein
MLFYFNQWSALLLPFFLQGIIFAFLLLWRGWREERLTDYLLAALLFIFTLRVANWMLGFAHWYDAHDWHSTFMFYFPFNHWLLIGPLTYFYFRSLTNRDFRICKKDRWHFAPWMFDMAISAFVFTNDIVIHHWIRGEALPYHFGTQGTLRMEGIPVLDEALVVGAVISMLIYFGVTIRLYRQYRRQYVEEHFSDTAKVSFTWLRNFLYAVVGAILIWLVFLIVDKFGAQPLSYVQNWYSYFAWGIIIYYLSISGYYTRPAESLKLHFEPTPPSSTAATEDRIAEWKQKLQRYMETERPFLKQDLTLQELASKLGISATALSRTINTGFQQNFNDFINTYRVDAVKAKLLDPAAAHLSLLGIALDCGFNSKATFNRAFRKHAGTSPSEFIASQKKKPVSNS